MARVTSFEAGEFTSDDLENSIPFDPDKRLKGEEGAALLEATLAIVDAWEGANDPRTRALKQRDVETRRTTIDAFLANIAGAALNRARPEAFAAIPYSTTFFTGLGLAPKIMRFCRDALGEAGLIEGQHGFQKLDYYGQEKRLSRVTRLRATAAMREQLEGLNLRPSSVMRRRERDVIRVGSPSADLPPEPEDVMASRAVIDGLNARLAETSFSLPDEAWGRIRQAALKEDADDSASYQSFAGDMSATVLRRVFKENWSRGGRIYGGWWMHVPQSERQNITIEGRPTVELDYSRLHPALLFQKAGVELDFDPYEVPGVEGEHVRELGKRTFSRLINKERSRRGGTVTMNSQEKDRTQLPKRLSFRSYLNLFIKRLEPITPWLGTEVGMELQREDSDLAVAVIERLAQQGILTLPIHDSFIVEASKEANLRAAMGEVYLSKYGSIPLIK